MKKIIPLMAIGIYLPAVSFAQDGEYGPMQDGRHMMMPFGYGGILMWILLIIAIIVVVFLAARLPKDSGDSKKTEETALDILKKRYARGEISKEEFERMKKDLHAD